MKIKQLLILFIVLYYVPIHAQFSGDFAPSNWTFSSTTTGGDGSINTSGAPASVVLSGSDNDNGACCGLYENWAITIPQTGTISFSYSMVQPDIDNSYYVINGTTYSIATSTGSGTKSAIAVTAGQTFAFRIINDDNCCGRGVLVPAQLSTVREIVYARATNKKGIICPRLLIWLLRWFCCLLSGERNTVRLRGCLG